MSTITEPTDRMRELLAATTQFQTWVGIDPAGELEARKAAARLRIYDTEIARAEFIPDSMPCVLLFLTPYEGTRRSGGGNSFRFEFGIEAIFFSALTLDVKRDHTALKAAIKAFNESVFGIAAGASALADGFTHLLLQTCTQMFPATLNGFEIDEEGSVDWPYLCTGYRWASARLGATSA